jgi:ribosomal protein L7Ae-like RNA K-turn-binding protein
MGPDGPVADFGARLPGRGAWVHVDAACVRRADGPLARALDAPVVDAAKAVVDEVRAAVRWGLGGAAASGLVVSGAHQLDEAVRAGRVAGLVVATDASMRSVISVRDQVPHVPIADVALDRARLGACIGRGPRALVALVPARATTPLCAWLRTLQDLR